METLALLGLISILIVGMKWGPLVFTPLLDFLGQILELLSQMPRMIFVALFGFILWKLGLIVLNIVHVISDFPILSWEFITSALLIVVFIFAFLWDIRTATFPGIKIFKKIPKPILD